MLNTLKFIFCIIWITLLVFCAHPCKLHCQIHKDFPQEKYHLRIILCIFPHRCTKRKPSCYGLHIEEMICHRQKQEQNCSFMQPQKSPKFSSSGQPVNQDNFLTCRVSKETFPVTHWYQTYHSKFWTFQTTETTIPKKGILLLKVIRLFWRNVTSYRTT